MNREINYNIAKEYESIHAFFTEHHYPRGLVAALKRNPLVILNDAPAMAYYPLHIGDVLRIILPPEAVYSSEQILPTEVPLDIRYEDEDLLVINKPAGMSIHPSLHHYEDSLANAVAGYYQKQGTSIVFRCVNRLDKNTTGLTIIAKNQLASAVLNTAAKNRQIHRTYLAIVEGSLQGSGIIDAPIGRVDDSVILRQVDYDNGQSAITHYKALKESNGYTLVECHLETGRTHQIRIHMKHIGHPLPGDYLYHPVFDAINRQPLHSYSLTFEHPITGVPMEFTCPMPKDMEEMLS
ncbi:MAG: RluA family pseudouridine synthase [Lachnospiraceae bacterium]|nr:RluA family pseudouridine synthase [Lachnospiraceae bacterium]